MNVTINGRVYKCNTRDDVLFIFAQWLSKRIDAFYK